MAEYVFERAHDSAQGAMVGAAVSVSLESQASKCVCCFRRVGSVHGIMFVVLRPHILQLLERIERKASTSHSD